MDANSCLPPSITIGMPVYNEERFVGLAIESLLNQSFRNFRLIISDNASTDRTTAICREYAKQDSRIKLIVHGENLGAAENFRFVLAGVETPFFMWAGSHDLWDSSYLQELSRTLDRQPDAALAYARTRVIDGEGQTTIECTPDQLSYGDESPRLRGREIVRTLTWCNMVYGLFRTNAISNCRLDIPCLGNDLVFLMETALRGKIVHVASTTFIRREYRLPPKDERTQLLAQLRRILGKEDVARELDRRYTNWFYEHVRSAFRVPGSPHVRIYRALTLGAAFLERWEPQFESRSILIPFLFYQRCHRRITKIRRRFVRVGERIVTLFARPA